MSLLKVEIRPLVGSPVELNDVDGSGNHLYPLHDFDIIALIDQPNPAKRMAYPGEWPKFHYPAAQTIQAAGQILGIGGTDDARAVSYFNQRLALLDAITPPVQMLTSRHHGVLRVRMDGMTEDADVNVVCTQRSVPLQALFPANSQFTITWKAFEPYFTGVTTSTLYYLG